jgi:hypothetical protein
MSGHEKRPLVPGLRFPDFLEAGGWEEQKLGKFLTESRIYDLRKRNFQSFLCF